MSPPGSAAPRGTRWDLWPARSRARVLVCQEEIREIRRITRQLFGRRLQPWEYAGLTGAPDTARVDVSTYRNGLYLEMGDPVGNRYRAIRLVRLVGSKLIIFNDGFHIHLLSMQRKGLGLQIFKRQLDNAVALSVRRIEAVAGRRHNENGYYTWPRFGFDGRLPGRVRGRLPMGLEHATTVLELIDAEKGRLWWREHGCTIRVRFDVADQSRSREVFRRYLRHRLRSGRGSGEVGVPC